MASTPVEVSDISFDTIEANGLSNTLVRKCPIATNLETKALVRAASREVKVAKVRAKVVGKAREKARVRESSASLTWPTDPKSWKKNIMKMRMKPTHGRTVGRKIPPGGKKVVMTIGSLVHMALKRKIGTGIRRTGKKRIPGTRKVKNHRLSQQDMSRLSE